MITLLLGAEEAGLEVLDRDGAWLPINPPPGGVVCNIGDMLQRLTNHVLPSTTHRVVNPPPERRGFARYSTPVLPALRAGLPDPDPAGLRHARAARPLPRADHRRDYLAERLREIRLAWRSSSITRLRRRPRRVPTAGMKHKSVTRRARCSSSIGRNFQHALILGPSMVTM